MFVVIIFPWLWFRIGNGNEDLNNTWNSIEIPLMKYLNTSSTLIHSIYLQITSTSLTFSILSD